MKNINSNSNIQQDNGSDISNNQLKTYNQHFEEEISNNIHNITDPDSFWNLTSFSQAVIQRMEDQSTNQFLDQNNSSNIQSNVQQSSLQTTQQQQSNGRIRQKRERWHRIKRQGRLFYLKENIKKNVVKLTYGQLKSKIQRLARAKSLGDISEIKIWIDKFTFIGHQKGRITTEQKDTKKKNNNFGVTILREFYIEAPDEIKPIVRKYYKEDVDTYIDEYCSKHRKSDSNCLGQHPELFKEYCRFISKSLAEDPTQFKHLPKIIEMYQNVQNTQILEDL